MSRPPPTLYEVPLDAMPRVCGEGGCKARIVFIRSPKAYSKHIPLSIDSPLAVRSHAGVVMRAPSHFTDCTNPDRFSRRNR